MKQHVFKGNGRPTFVPPEIQAHYLDLETKEVYIARGVVNHLDWGNPVLDVTTLTTYLEEFETNLANGAGLNQVVDMLVQLDNGQKVVYIDIVDVVGKFVRINDNTDQPGNYEVRLRSPEGELLRLGSEFKIFNETELEPGLIHETDVLTVSGSLPTTDAIQRNGVVTVKYFVDRGMVRHFVVFGDTTRASSGAVPLAENAALLNGRSYDEIVQQIKATLDDGLATDQEVSTVLQELASSIDQASNLINPPA